MTDWPEILLNLLDRGDSPVLVTVAATWGSVPREAGAKMIVSRNQIHGSIGGGHLEYKSIGIARDWLAEPVAAESRGFFREFPLGPSLGQCCGGRVVLLFERIDEDSRAWLDVVMRGKTDRQAIILLTLWQQERIRKIPVNTTVTDLEEVCRTLPAEALAGIRRLFSQGADGCELGNFPAKPDEPVYFIEKMSTAEFPVFLFGAGHIGRALVRVLADTPCRITWVDSRDDIFPTELPGNVQTVSDEQPVFEVDAAPPGACFIVMTHDHQLDGRLCERILRRGDYAWCGLIGSGSKRRKLEKRLRQVGITEQAIKSLVCPIGINGISGKQPQVIAIAVAAQLLAVREAATHADTYCTAHPG